MSKVMYLFDHVKRVARDRQVKPVTDKSTASKIFHGLAIGKRDLPTLKKVYGKQAGFSLIELTVVVAIVSLLSVIAIPYYQTFAKKAQRVEAKTGLSGLFTMMTIYQLENGKGTSSMSDLGFSMKGTPKYSYGFQSHFTDGNVDGNSDGADGTNEGRAWTLAVDSNASQVFNGRLGSVKTLSHTECGKTENSGKCAWTGPSIFRHLPQIRSVHT